MIVGNELRFVRFEFQETMPEHLPGGTDMACSVEASCDGFKGKVEDVWFARDDINQFLSELQELEEKRKGSAKLVNMSSPSEANPLRFEIYTIDAVGHLGVSAELLKTTHLGDSSRWLKVSVSFPVDAGDLPSMLIEFRKLFDRKQGRI